MFSYKNSSYIQFKEPKLYAYRMLDFWSQRKQQINSLLQFFEMNASENRQKRR